VDVASLRCQACARSCPRSCADAAG
jgi:hypothetical protein